MKWALAVLAVLVFLGVNGTLSGLVNKKLEARAADGRREFCQRLAMGDVPGAVQHVPQNTPMISPLTHTAKVMECRDEGGPQLVAAVVSGACRELRQEVRVKWDSGDAVDVAFTYSCLPFINIEYTDIEKGAVTPARP